jgi:hypothetical protein
MIAVAVLGLFYLAAVLLALTMIAVFGTFWLASTVVVRDA